MNYARYVLFSFRGRLNRLPYFLGGLGALLLGGLLIGLAVALATGNSGENGVAYVLAAGLGLASVVAVCWMHFALLIKRLHDMDMSGYHVIWITLINSASGALSNHSLELGILFGLVSVGVTLWLMFKPGTNGDNRFGPSPLHVRQESLYYVPPHQRAGG